jgi:ribonuclease P protein component
VIRNKVRRRLRHLVRDRLATLPAGADLVVRALPAAASRSYRQLGTELDAALAAAARRSRKRNPAEREVATGAKSAPSQGRSPRE